MMAFYGQSTKNCTMAVSSSHLQSLTFTDRELRIGRAGGRSDSFRAMWLRDNCSCPECRHESAGQRLLDTLSVPTDLAIASASPAADGTIDIVWSDGHVSRYADEWLLHHARL